MPPAKNKTPGQSSKISSEVLRRVWGELKPNVLLERLRALQPTSKWSASGSRIHGCCPFHDESTPSFYIYLDRGYAKCFGCEKFVWNPVELWARIKGGNKQSEALTEIRQTFGIKFLTPAASNELAAWERNQLLKRSILRICHDELINAINSPGNAKYAYAKHAVNYLLNTRCIPVDALPTLHMVGVLPPVARLVEILRQEAERENVLREEKAQEINERVEKFVSLETEAKDYVTSGAGWVGSIVFRLDKAPDTIGRIKLRRPDTKDFLILPDAFDEDLGFFGLSWSMYTPLLGSQQKYAWPYVVEGEFDALSIMARQVKSGNTSLFVLGAGGSSGGGYLDTLSSFGFHDIYLIGDAPEKKGNELIEHWLPNVQKLRAKIFVGYDRFPGRGDPDEIVVGDGLPALQAALLDIKNTSVFAYPPDWVFEQAQVDLENVAKNDVRALTEVAGTWGRLLKNNIECDAYAEMCQQAYGIQKTILKREITSREETEPAFIARVVSVLQEIFFVVGQEALENDRRLYLWHKEKRASIQVSLGDLGSIERELGAVLGTSYQLFDEKIGIPAFLEPTPEQKAGKYLQKMDRDYRFYLSQALLIMTQNAPDITTAQRMAQGVHVVRNAGRKSTVYVVNGKEVYLGEYDDMGDLNWIALDGPSHNGIIFDIGMKVEEKPWMPWVKSAQDLNDARNVDVKDAWSKLHHALDIGWRYKNHAVTTDFLAAHLMASTVCRAFRRQIIVSFHADTRSGKSRMIMGLIGGNDFPQIHLIAAAVGLPMFTPAGVRQRMNNKARPLCLDEFEDEGDHDKKSKAITEVLEMFRNLLGEDNQIVQGSRDQNGKAYHLNFFLYLASIKLARKVQDANRMLTVFMERSNDRADPVIVLENEFGEAGLLELKQKLSLALLPHIATIQEHYQSIIKEFGLPGKKPTSIDSRVFEALYPALTIMKFLGLDYQKFVIDYCGANKDMLTMAASHTDSMALFDWITQTANLKIRVGERNDRNDASVLQLMMSPETRHEINLSGSGLFYDEPSATLIVNWTTAIQKVLSGHSRYSRETNIMNLRELANRVPHAVKPAELEGSGALTRLKAYGLGGVTAHQLTAYKMTHILQELKNAPVPEEKPEPEAVPKKQQGAEDFDNADFSK